MRIPIVDRMMSLVRKPAVKPTRGISREDRVRAAYDQLPLGIAIATADGHWLFVNERFRTMAGYTSAEFGRITLQGITHPEDLREERPLMKRLVAGELASYRIEKRIMARNGRYCSFEVLTALANGVFIYVLDEPQPSVLDHLHGIAVIRTDQRGVITGWSAGAEAMFGYQRAEILGKNRRVLYRDADSWAGKSTSALQNASEQRMEMDDWRVRKDGAHLWARCSISTFESAGVSGYVETVMAASEPAIGREETPKPASPAARAADRESIELLRLELEKSKRMEESLREAFDDVRRTSEETMTELRIMTGALRDEIDRRKAVEDELRRTKAQLAVATAAVVVAAIELPVPVPAEPAAPSPVEKDVERISVTAPPALSWQELASTTPAAVLQELAAAQRTGTLLISSGTREKEIFFEDGRVFSCSSNDPQKFLAERLTKRGIISDEQRRKAVEINQASRLALGRILLILGAINEKQLIEAMLGKLDDEIAELLTWSDGRFVFVEGEVPSLQLVPLRIEVAELLSPPVRVEVEEPLSPPMLYIASAKSGKVHQLMCTSVKRMSASARLEVTTTEGFELCRVCFR